MSDLKEDRWFKQPLTIREACLQGASILKAEAVEEPRNNAELLLMHVLGIDRAMLLRDGSDPFPAHKLEEWEQLIRRKAHGEPVQYMIGEQWFYGRPFAVSPAVLIPRPETELLVEAVLEAVDRLWPAAASGERAIASDGSERGSGERAIASDGSERVPAGECELVDAVGQVPTVVDVGTGSGAIAVTLASQRPLWRVNASDLSPDALEVARTNAVRHEAADRMAFVQGDLLAPFLQRREVHLGSSAAQHVELRIDVLVSNPPYIPAADMQGLQREVRDYEPHLALDGGADGLVPYRRMLEQLPLLVQIPRVVAFELGINQPRIIADMMQRMGLWDDIRIITDYGGIERHVLAVKHLPR